MALLVRRTATGYRTESLPTATVLEAMAFLERQGPDAVGIHLEHLNLTVTWCGCTSGCPACQYTGHRVWRGKGPLAPFILPAAENQ